MSAKKSTDRVETATTTDEEPPEALLELTVTPERLPDVRGVFATRVDRAESNILTVHMPMLEHAVPARLLSACGELTAGDEVLVVCDRGDPTRPIILGRVLDPNAALTTTAIPDAPATVPLPPNLSLSVDGRRMVLEAEEEMVFQCGAASITLTRAGKILIRGAYLSSRSSGAHRIRGASVEIN